MTKLARVCDSIVARIESGALREGDRLPSESQLAASFRVSVGTVQKALSRLAHSGLISREHGRGTFVSGSRIGAADVNYLRFRDAEGRDLPHYIRVTSVRRLMRKGPWSEFLGAQAGHIRIERLINVGGKVQIEASGFEGETCVAFSEAYERGLGIAESTRLKPEFHMKAEDKTAQELRRF